MKQLNWTFVSVSISLIGSNVILNKTSAKTEIFGELVTDQNTVITLPQLIIINSFVLSAGFRRLCETNSYMMFSNS